jgi:hypothetical protein
VQIAELFSGHLSRAFSDPDVMIISYQLLAQKLIFDNLYSVDYPRCTELPQIGNSPHCSDVPCVTPEPCSGLLTSVEAMEESCASGEPSLFKLS